MISRSSKRGIGAALVAALLGAFPISASATLQTDPLLLYKNMKTAYDRGAAAGWHQADEVDYFSTVLDAGRAFELARHDDPTNAQVKATALDLAVRLNYDPLINHDGAEWYVRLAAAASFDDPVRRAEAKALVAKLDAEDISTVTLARDADTDASANVTSHPGDAQALIDQVDADVSAYKLSGDERYRSIAIQRAAQAQFPIGSISQNLSDHLFGYAQSARSGTSGYSPEDRAAAIALFSHKTSNHSIPLIGRVLSHQGFLVITAPADEYFGRTKLSPIGVTNEIVRIGKYLDVGWGARMTSEALYVVDAIDDWQHQYPRDYALPRLLLGTYKVLDRIDSPEAHDARAKVRHILTVEYNGSTEAKALLAS